MSAVLSPNKDVLLESKPSCIVLIFGSFAEEEE